MKTRRRTPLGDDEIESAQAEAQQRIDDRERCIKLRDYRNALVAVHNSVTELRGQGSPLLVELRREIRRTDDERAVYSHHGGLDTWREIAMDGEDLEATTMRVLLERGVTPYRYARDMRPDLDSADVGGSTELDQAKTARAERREHLEGQLESARWLLAELERGETFASRVKDAPITAERVAREIARLSTMIEQLSP